MRITTVFRRLLGVISMCVDGVGLEGEELVLDVAPSWRRPRCPTCGKACAIHETREPRFWRDLAFGKTVTLLRYAPRRVDCSTCGVHVEAVPWAAPKSRFTRRLEELVAYLAQQMSKTAVCKLTGIDWRTVGTIIARIISEKLDPTRLDDLTVIGVDELSFRRHHNYVTVVVDHVRQRIIWVGEGKSSDTLAEFFKVLGPERARQLTHVTMDLSAAYRSSVATHAPQAELVFDRFHIQRLASDAVDAVRRDEARAADDAASGGSLKHSRWALLKNPWNLNATEKQKLADLERLNRRVFRAYLLKEKLAEILSRRQPGVAAAELGRWASSPRFSAGDPQRALPSGKNADHQLIKKRLPVGRRSSVAPRRSLPANALCGPFREWRTPIPSPCLRNPAESSKWVPHRSLLHFDTPATPNSAHGRAHRHDVRNRQFALSAPQLSMGQLASRSQPSRRQVRRA